MELKPGMWLHASCSDEWYGPILRVGKDDNESDVIDLTVPDINEFIDCERWSERGETAPSLMRVECGPVVFRDLQWRPVKDSSDLIECNTPGHGCYRCTELFSVHAQKDTNT